MGKWAQSRHRSSQGQAQAFSLVLTVLGEPDIEWAWSGPNPDHWSIETSANEIGPFAEVATEPGNLRTDSHTSSHDWVRVIGLDAGNAPVTPYSNVENQF
jgi:hypothetical protein